MKPSEILNKLKLLEIFENLESSNDIKNYINFFNQQFDDVDLIDHDELKSLEDNLLQSLDLYKSYIKDFKTKLNKDFFSSNEDNQRISDIMWDKNLEKITFEVHTEWLKLWPPRNEEYDKFVALCQKYARWEIPGAVIGAKDTDLLHKINFTEPFYSVERFEGYLELQKQTFNEITRRRVLWYKLEDIEKLPNNALGLIVIYNELPFMPFSASSVLLKTLASKLHPGGTLIFNYNDCLTVPGLEYFQNNSMVFTTPDMFDQLLLEQDLIKAEQYNSKFETFSWLVYQKAGKYKAIKKCSSFGIITKQPSLNTPDHPNRLEEIRKLVKEQNT